MFPLDACHNHVGMLRCTSMPRCQPTCLANPNVHGRVSRSRPQVPLHRSVRQADQCSCKHALQTIAGQRSLLATLGGKLLTAVLAAALVSNPGLPAQAEDGFTIRFKASREPAIRKAQEALVQTWGFVSTQFIDASFGGADWPQELQSSLDKSFEARAPADVYKIIVEMLGKLGDPFTRVIPPQTAGAFENVTEGQVISMGFQISEDTPGPPRVVFVANNSPAQDAGVQMGDRLLTVNRKDTSAAGKQELAALLRSEADLVLQRDSPTPGRSQRIALHLVARPIEVHPVQYAVLPGAKESEKTAYIRLFVFSKNAPKDVAEALEEVQKQQATSVILDLRDNVGGVVLSGFQVAQLFLPEGSRFCYVEDGRGAAEDVVMHSEEQIQPIRQPMVVLVNGGTASTAELIAASLHDNQRAMLLGEKTFGKGRTQRIIQLQDGGLLLLSNTLYLTPQHQKVDKVGLIPDVACKPDATDLSFWNSGDRTGSESLLEDPCIAMAIEKLHSA